MEPQRIDKQINVNQKGKNNNQYNTFHLSSSPKYTPSYHLPYPPSPNFSGREGLLAKLHDRLQVSPCAITAATAAVAGMPGVGKTELALQYASEYGKSYGGGSYWLVMRDRDLATVLAQHVKDEFGLDLPPEKIDKREIAQWCWRQWERNLPENSAVLVVLDNVDETDQIGGMLPGSRCFRLLVTTRRRALDATFAEELLEELTNPAALEFLEKLVGSRVSQEPAAALQLCHELLGNLPLGIELAGRYLQQDAELSIAAYVAELSILHESLDVADTNQYPTMNAERGVRLALKISWQKLGAGSQTVAKLLGWCALQAIPWELTTEMALMAGETKASVRQARQQLENLHLMKWDAECKAATLHTLVRDFLKLQSQGVAKLQQIFVDTMWHSVKKTEPLMTLEQLAVLRNIVPHIEEVANYYSDLLSEDKLMWGFVGIARFYESQCLHVIAEKWYSKCLKVVESRLVIEHSNVGNSLNNLGMFYESKGRYSEAEPLLLRSLDIAENQLGTDYSFLGSILNNLAQLYRVQSYYSKAEPLYLRSLIITEKQEGVNHPNVAAILDNMAKLCQSQGRYSKVEALFLRSLAIRESQPTEHPDIASSLNNLATFYESQDRYSEAEPLYLRSLKIMEHQLGTDHPNVATILNNLGVFYKAQSNYSKAESLYQRSLEIIERQLGIDHPKVASILNNIAKLYESQGRYSDAESLFLRSLAIREEKLGANHPDTATGLNNLAGLYELTGKQAEAEPLYARALQICEQSLGIGHPTTIDIRRHYAQYLRRGK
jgi:tetratricopeptide (TPR) repeat protein